LAPIFRGKEDELVKRFSVITRVLDTRKEVYVSKGRFRVLAA
jgi:hypothetical protein